MEKLGKAYYSDITQVKFLKISYLILLRRIVKVRTFLKKNKILSTLYSKGVYYCRIVQIYWFHWRNNKIAQKKIKNKELLNVLFMLWSPAMWKGEALMKAMEKHPRFCPAFWILKKPNLDEQLAMNEVQAAIKYAESHNHLFFVNESLDEVRKEFDPDILFLVQPYGDERVKTKNELICFIPYAYSTIDGAFLYTDYASQFFFRYYTESECMRMFASKYMMNGGINLRATGLPIAEELVQSVSEEQWYGVPKSKKKIIWAPHWTILSVGAAFNASTFMDIAWEMLNIAKKYEESVHFAFKPHPWLIRELYKVWGKEKADVYYRFWGDGVNTQLVEGAYVSLFQQSDAMIHDSSSFIQEYLLMDKPCMYLMRKDASVNFNDVTERALACYQKGTSIGDIELFIENVIAGKDFFAEKRRSHVNEYLMPKGCSPVQNIIDDLLNP